MSVLNKTVQKPFTIPLNEEFSDNIQNISARQNRRDFLSSEAQSRISQQYKRLTMDYHSYTGRKSHLLVSHPKCSRLVNSPLNFYKRLHTVKTQRNHNPMKSE